MGSFVLKALDYGVLGLCAVMVVVAARVIYQEQSREGSPRTALLKYVYSFMVFCLLLAGLNAYVQLSQRPDATDELTHLKAEIARLSADVQAKDSQLVAKDKEIAARDSDLRTIKLAANPILRLRQGLIEQLPTSAPEKKALGDCVEELKKLLK